MPQIFCFGDSITQGFWDTEGGWVQRLWSELDEAKVSSESERYEMYNLGVSGDTTEDILHRFEFELKARLDEDDKQIVLFAVGVNDSQYLIQEKQLRFSVADYQKNLEALVDKAKKLNAHVVIVGLAPIDQMKVDPMPWADDRSYRTEYIEQFNEVAKKVAENTNCLFIDLYGPLQEQRFAQYLPDGVHPNDEGHQKMYELIKGGLRQSGLVAS